MKLLRNKTGYTILPLKKLRGRERGENIVITEEIRKMTEGKKKGKEARGEEERTEWKRKREEGRMAGRKRY